MLGRNAAETYGFDVDALRPLADKVGPTPAELGQEGVDLEVGRAAGRRTPVAHRHRSARPRGWFVSAAPSPSIRSSRASTPGPTTSTAAARSRAGPLERRCCRAGCSPASRTSRGSCATTGQQRPRPGEAVAGRRPAAGPVGPQRAPARRHDARADGRPRARPHPQAPAAAVHAPARSSGARTRAGRSTRTSTGSAPGAA